MTTAKVLDVSVGLCAEFMAGLRPDFTAAEWGVFNDVIKAGDRNGLGAFCLNPQPPNPGRITDGSISAAADLHTLFANASPELNVHRDVLSGILLLTAFAARLAQESAARKAVEPMAAEDARSRTVRHFDVVVAFQITGDPHRAEMLGQRKSTFSSCKRGVLFACHLGILERQELRMPIRKFSRE